jgi:flagellar basal-body rod protein FlgB
MIESLFNQTNFVAAKQLLDVTVLRHEAIAGNLANLETPNYKRLDVSGEFEKQLQESIGSGSTRRLAGMRPQITEDKTATASRRDGNTVDLEKELVHLNRNGVEHAVESHLITGGLLKLRLAITGRAG